MAANDGDRLGYGQGYDLRGSQGLQSNSEQYSQQYSRGPPGEDTHK